MKNTLHLVGLSYKTAPVEVREAFALTSPELIAKGIIHLDDCIKEYMILSTCNRVEILAIGKNGETRTRILNLWAKAVGKPLEGLEPYTYVYHGEAAITHLFSVASSLDSMILGEPQILGQLKEAYRFSLQQKTAKIILSRLLHKSFSVAKRVRTETAIASSAVSISYAAIELAKRIFDDMQTTKAMLIGAGEMAELAATYLVNAGIKSICVANRTTSRAEQLAAQFGGTAVPFTSLLEYLPEVDIVISSTAAHEPILRASDMHQVMKKRKNKPMFFIDIAVPRDIAPDINNLDNIYLYDIDDLKEVVDENVNQRKAEALKAQALIAEETTVFCHWMKSLALQPSIVDLISQSQQSALAELDKTLKRLGPITPEQKEALEIMLFSIVKKLNHEPISFLKRSIGEEGIPMHYMSLFRRIFNLDGDVVPSDAHAPGKNCTDDNQS